MQTFSEANATLRGPRTDVVRCGSCPRRCVLEVGQQGYCEVRVREGDAVVVSPAGLASGFRVEPIEAFGLNHFLPGTMALAVGRGGSNLRTRSSGSDYQGDRGAPPSRRLVGPARIAAWAQELGCPTVALGGTDPAVAVEYATDVAAACRAAGLRTVALSRGYMNPSVCAAFFHRIDAARIELLGFTERGYRRYGGHLAPVLDTLTHLAHGTRAWLEVSLRLQPGQNDSVSELRRLAAWIVTELGSDTPLHLETRHLLGMSADRELAAAELAAVRAERLARLHGLRHVYTDDLFDHHGRTTVCDGCGTPLVEREWYLVTRWNLVDGDRCPTCGARCAGHFAEARQAA